MDPHPSKSHTLVRRAWLTTGTSFKLVLICLAVPMIVIRPFTPQEPHQLNFALGLRGQAPFLSSVAAILSACALFTAWKFLGLVARVILSLLLLLTVAGATLTRVNIFEVMFKPYGAAAFTPAAEAQVDADDKVLAFTAHGESRAYPIRSMGYHHIVNDTVGAQPIAVTYCTLCHTGLIWSRDLDGRTLTFRLAGINNGNALLRDEQTSSIWQQSTGEAIFGPLKGRHLTLLHTDELTFAQWRAEQPAGLVLKPDQRYAAEYDPKNWEEHIARTHAVVDTAKTGISPHELMLGISAGTSTKAFPVQAVLASGLIQDRVGSLQVLIVVGPDHASIRAFETQPAAAATPLTFVSAADVPGAIMKDTETGSAFNFQGCAVSGPRSGQCLTPIESHKDYWFDWLNHNPATTVFKS